MYPMLHTKFQGHRPIGSGEKKLNASIIYIGIVVILTKKPGQFKRIFIPSEPLVALYEI